MRLLGRQSGLPYVLVGLLFLLSCKRSELAVPEIKPERIPVALQLIKTIEGNIFGQKISRPSGVSVDQAGNVFLIDKGNNRLVKLDPKLIPVRDAAGYGNADGLLNEPVYLCINNNLNLYVSDQGNRRVTIFNSQLNYADKIEFSDPDDPLKFGRPAGIVTTDIGEVWVADQDNSRIAVFNNFNNFERFIGGDETYSGLFLLPEGMTKNQFGQIIVADRDQGMLFAFDNYGLLIGEIGKENLVKPVGLDIDFDGNIWVVDAGIPGIVCLEPSGKFLFATGSYGKESDYGFNEPIDLAVLPDNRLIICDSGNDRLLVYKILY
jgi:DNA-binding beta-propeller fold protein YncE